MRNDDLQALGRTVTKACTGLGLALALIGLGAGTASAQVPITTLGTPVTENFDSLLRTGGTHSEVPAGWSLLETGDNADQKYGVSTGGGNTADSYSFGANNGTDRAFGSVASGNLETAIGARFVNNAAAPITSLAIQYTGEWWHAGDSASDSIVFEYSLNATNLSTGTWVAVTELDFSHLDVSCQTAGNCGPNNAARDGNAAAFRKQKTANIGGLSIAAGASFWIRWRDVNGVGADQGLAIDDFSLNTNVVAAADPIVQIVKSVDLVADPVALPGSVLEYSFLVSVDATSTQGVRDFVLTDSLPDTVNAITSQVDPSYVFSIEVDDVVNLTAAADGDAGEIVNGVVTLRLGELAVDSLAEVKFRVSVAKTTTKFTLANVGSATFDGAVTGTGFEVDSTEALIAVVACEESADCDDDDVCTAESCNAGNCVAETIDNDCDDANVCTTDRCDAALGCQHDPNALACDDGVATTVNDHCDGAGKCIGTSSECPADPICGHYTFDGATCVLAATTGACDDGDPCTTGDVCADSVCSGGPKCAENEVCGEDGSCTEVSPDVGPEVVEESIEVEIQPEVVAETSPEATPESGPEATPETTPETSPEVAEGGDVGADAGGDTGPNIVDGDEDGCAGGAGASLMGLGLLAVFVLRRRVVRG